MRSKENNKHTVQLNDVELGIVKRALEYYFINSDKLLICKNWEKKLFDLVNRITKLSEGKTLIEKMKEEKKERNV